MKKITTYCDVCQKKTVHKFQAGEKESILVCTSCKAVAKKIEKAIILHLNQKDIQERGIKATRTAARYMVQNQYRGT